MPAGLWQIGCGSATLRCRTCAGTGQAASMRNSAYARTLKRSTPSSCEMMWRNTRRREPNVIVGHTAGGAARVSRKHFGLRHVLRGRLIE
jgi:hypothetical protein